MIYSLALTGPTASGKTSLSLHVARELGCEIISCDSMQIYRGMDIGTAKATAEERLAVPHHLIDFLSPTENYSAESYREDALKAAKEITGRGRIPLFVGGTGLYVDSLLRASMEGVPESSSEYRKRIEDSIKTEDDVTALWNRLNEVDPESAEKIHKNNLRRVIRALEIYDATGKPKSYFDKLSQEASADIKLGMVTLDFHNRENLYSRVDRRVDAMMDEGLLDEVKGLYEQGLLGEKTTASQAIGYKELLLHIRGELTLTEAKELLKQSTRRYAKRQLTWFRHEKDAVHLYLDSEDGKLLDSGAVAEEALAIMKKMIIDIKE